MSPPDVLSLTDGMLPVDGQLHWAREKLLVLASRKGTTTFTEVRVPCRSA